MPSPKNRTNVEVLGPQKRRRWSPQEKLAMVQQSYEPGYSVSLVARQHGVNANQLFLWRKQHQQGELTPVAVGQNNTQPMQLYAATTGWSIEVSYPQNLVSKTYLSYRKAGSTGDWTTPTNLEAFQSAFGSAHRFDIAKLNLGEGGYEYRITNLENGAATAREVGSGTFTIYGPNTPDKESYPPIPGGVSQGSSLIDGQAYRVLQWPKPGTDWTVTFRYRPAGSTGDYIERTTGNGLFAYGDGRTSGMGIGMQGIALNLGAGNFEYEVVAKNAATGAELRSTGNVNTPGDFSVRNVTPAIYSNNNNVQNR